MKDAIITMSIAAVIIMLLFAILTTIMGTPDRVCQSWEIVPKHWPW